jgi:hypothetical protein
MELGAHSVMIMAGHRADYIVVSNTARWLKAAEGGKLHTQRSVLPVPNANRLIIGGRQDPRELMVEENGANVIEMTVQCEKTSSRLVGPDFDLVVVTTRYEKRLRFMEVDASNRPVVFLESIDERAHSIVPKLNGGRMEGDENPWSS